MYYGSGSNMITSIVYPPSLLCPTEIVKEVKEVKEVFKTSE